ncbi:MAG: efflux RND transporter periplasmic adaptor subunit [Elusimicrobiales bacterium]|nr:efflux RND transporter periplasmic adaptor subunit [Elusimicrobiales bacterium]
MKKTIIVALILIIAAGVYYFTRKKDSKEEFTYKQIETKMSDINDYVEVTGQIEPLNRVEILPPSSGRIEKIFVEEGAVVKAGDVLCLMSSSDRVAIMDAARSISEEEYKKWEDSYKPIKVLAPITGRIILRNIVEGQTVGGSTVLFAMSDTLIAVASVDESDIGKIKVGQSAFITLDSYPETLIKGKIFQILDEGKNVSNVIIYKVKIKLENIPSFLKSQMTSNIKIMIARRRILALPLTALEYSKDGKVYVITGFDSKKTPVKKEVSVGKDYDNLVEIRKGLEEGEKVYVKMKKYSKQSMDQGANPFMPQRRPQQQRQVMRRL